MIDAIMLRLKYINPPEYHGYSSYRGYLRNATHFSCAYCTISESESPGATFNIEHFKPRKYFPDLTVKCENLRYACPRCNSYKGDLWISETEGCSRNCKNCQDHVCEQNIGRFIDSTKESPPDAIYLGDDDKLYAYANSKPADYTIKYLRLNRSPLIKLRHTRRFMDSWLRELEKERQKATQSLAEITEKKRTFEIMVSATVQGNIDAYQGVVTTMYEMLVVQAEQSLLLINEEMRKLSFMLEQHLGCDERIANS
jgi:HNH endonuclease.